MASFLDQQLRPLVSHFGPLLTGTLVMLTRIVAVAIAAYAVQGSAATPPTLASVTGVMFWALYGMTVTCAFRCLADQKLNFTGQTCPAGHPRANWRRWEGVLFTIVAVSIGAFDVTAASVPSLFTATFAAAGTLFFVAYSYLFVGYVFDSL